MESSRTETSISAASEQPPNPPPLPPLAPLGVEPPLPPVEMPPLPTGSVFDEDDLVEHAMSSLSRPPLPQESPQNQPSVTAGQSQALPLPVDKTIAADRSDERDTASPMEALQNQYKPVTPPTTVPVTASQSDHSVPMDINNSPSPQKQSDYRAQYEQTEYNNDNKTEFVEDHRPLPPPVNKQSTKTMHPPGDKAGLAPPPPMPSFKPLAPPPLPPSQVMLPPPVNSRKYPSC